jgi:hypothetical protein
MDPLIWKNLPSELVLKIVLLSKPSIDVRLAFHIPPQKLCKIIGWRLYYKLQSARNGLIYNTTSKSLHIFRVPGTHIIRRPIELNVSDEWFTFLNQEQHDHTLEIILPSGAFHVSSSNVAFVTEVPVLLVTS